MPASVELATTLIAMCHQGCDHRAAVVRAQEFAVTLDVRQFQIIASWSEAIDLAEIDPAAVSRVLAAMADQTGDPFENLGTHEGFKKDAAMRELAAKGGWS